MKLPCLLLAALLSGLVALPAQATCPSTVSRIQHHANDEWVARQLLDIYHEVGCTTKFLPQPGKRGIIQFNTAELDGLSARIPRIENLLNRDFIRSAHPVAEITGQIYSYSPADRLLHDQAQMNKPFGYVRGILWQEKAGLGGAGVSFDGANHMYQAVRLKRIDRLMLSNYGFALSVRRGDLPKGAIAVGKVTLNAKLYHYLAKSHEDVMGRINQKLAAWPARFDPARLSAAD